MTIEVKVPVLAESTPDATLLDWRKSAGDAVEENEILIELETDKVVLEVPAPTSGVLAEIVRQTGDTVVSDDVLARIEPGAAGAAASAPAVEPSAEPAAAEAAPAAAAAAPGLSPAVRKLVEEHALDPSAIEGTGKGGRITKGDVLAHLERAPAAPPTPPAPAREPAPAPASEPAAKPAPAPGARSERREPMSRLRQRVAERLVEAQSTAAILTTFNEVNMGPVMALRKRYRDRFEETHGARLGFMSFFVQAAHRCLNEIKKYRSR